ncbi:MAG: MFS transporter [Asticcacaulis sp.]|nr:MFS transporter [Asticcacaulis sp.]
MVLMGGLLALTLPRRQPDHKVTYVRLIHSLTVLWRAHPTLRLRTFFQACMFCAFSLFWTVAPLELAGRFHLTQTGIALFALVGATGALAAPLSGRLADAGHTVKATFGALAVGAAAMLVTLLPSMRGVIVLALLGVVLDFCVQMNMVQGQRAIYALDPMSRGRVNGIYMAGIFTGGAIGSAVASPLYESGGWEYVALAGGLALLLALGVFVANYRRA